MLSDSLYTIDVGPRNRDGSRKVTLMQEGKEFFSVHHREVVAAFLAFFPEPAEGRGTGELRVVAAALESTQRHAEVAGDHAQVPLPSPSRGTPPQSADATIPAHVLNAVLPDPTSPQTSDATDAPSQPCEYLCVFHQEELCDSRGYYQVGQPQMLCSAYRARDGTFTQLAPHGVDPSRVLAGVSGVFLHASFASAADIRSLPAPLHEAGQVFFPAMDLWWMASPLACRPVYVSAETAERMLADAVAAAAGPHSPWRRSSGVGAGSTVTSPSHSTVRDYASRAHSVSAGVPQESTRLAWGTALDAVYLDTEIIGQFRGPSAQLYVLARTGGQEVRIARTNTLASHDVVCWEWLPHRCDLVGLGEVDTSALTLTVPGSMPTGTQILFVTAASQGRTWVIRSANLSREDAGPDKGGSVLEVLLILPVGIAPLILPCVRPLTPPPVLLCNSPHDGFVSIMNLPALTRFDVGRGRVSAEQMESLLVYSAPLHTIAEPTAVGSSGNDTSNTQAAVGATAGSRVDLGAESSLGAATPPRTSDRPRHGGAAGLGHIEQVQMTRDGRLVFSSTRDTAAATASCEGENGVQWRRCEVSCQCSVTLPNTTGSAETLLVAILDALQAALSTEAATDLEYAFLRACWHQGGAQRNSFATVATVTSDILLQTVDDSLRAESHTNDQRTAAMSAQANVDEGQADKAASAQALRGSMAALADPLRFNAAAVGATAHCLFSTPRTGPSGATGTPATSAQTVTRRWSRAMCEVAVLTLHQLCEACSLQDRYWHMVRPLSELVLAMSRRVGWVAYTTHYQLMLPHASSCTREPVAPQLPPSHAPPAAPACVSTQETDALYDLYQRRFVSATVRSTRNEIVTRLSVPPLLRQIMQYIVRGVSEAAPGTLWPILRGLPLEHPLSVANRLYCLMVTCFGKWPSSSPTHADEERQQEGMLQPLHAKGSRSPQRETEKQGRYWWYTLCEWLPKLHLSSAELRSQVCLGTGFPISQALACAKETPALQWREGMHAVVGRVDCVRDRVLLDTLTDHSRSLIRLTEERVVAQPSRSTLLEDDGVSLRPDFPKTWSDARLDVPQVIFNTAAPISLPSQVDGSEELFSALTTLSRTAMSLPTGRGMLTMNTQNFKLRDSIPVPPLNLNGVTTEGIHITNNAEEVAPERLLWPTLHNGCAAGFRFLPLRRVSGAPHAHSSRDHSGPSDTESAITRQWVVYQTRSISPPPARAGMLLAAGVLGHLQVLQLTDIYALLVSQQPNYAWREVTTTAVMLGLGCSFRGTGSDLIFRCLSMHVRSLTPTTEDIEVSLDVQTAAVLAMGMLCQQMPSNVFMVEVFMQEMSRLPSDEHCMRREGYALAAGMGLGLLLLGVGDGHSVPHIEERLFQFMQGARREPPPSWNQGATGLKELGHDHDHFLTRALLAQNATAANTGNSCTRVFEGGHYNVNVTAPAAAMALGLIYLQTENALVSARLAPPDRLVALQSVSPAMCLLRSIVAPLVRWRSIEPTREWLFAHVPEKLVNLCKHGHAALPLAKQQVQYLLLNLGHCIAGAALAVGLRYAGSMNADARQTILSELQGFARGCVGTTGVTMTTFQKSCGAFEKCIAACAIAVSLVMAGGGDLHVLSELRKLHARNLSHKDAYGTNMAVSTAMGLLFLGSGRLTLSNSLPSVAALLIAFYPMWPTGPEDNVRHLQAFRHLYALAVVPRLMETMDAVTGRPVSVPVRLVLSHGRIQTKDGLTGGGLLADQHILWTPVPRGKEEQEVCLQTPCLLPPPETIERVEIRSSAHYPLVITNHGARIISDRGLVVRVLEKQQHGDHPRASAAMDHGGAAESFAEVRVMDWIHCLLHHRGDLSLSSVLIILQELALLRTGSPSLSTRSNATPALPAHGGGEGCVSVSFAGTMVSAPQIEPHRLVRHDFLLALSATLEDRYSFVFLRGPRGSCEGHPLHALLIRCQSPTVVLDTVARRPGGSISFPCHFRGSHSRPVRADGLGEEVCVSETSTVCAVHEWMVEALCFFGITTLLQPLRTVLAKEGAQLGKKSTRRLALLKMNRTLVLPMRTLECIVSCCYDE